MRRDAEIAAVERLDELIADLSTDPAEPNASAERVKTPSVAVTMMARSDRPDMPGYGVRSSETPNATEPSGVAGELQHSQAPGFKAGSDLGENASAGGGARSGPRHSSQKDMPS